MPDINMWGKFYRSAEDTVRLSEALGQYKMVYSDLEFMQQFKQASWPENELACYRAIHILRQAASDLNFAAANIPVFRIDETDTPVSLLDGLATIVAALNVSIDFSRTEREAALASRCFVSEEEASMLTEDTIGSSWMKAYCPPEEWADGFLYGKTRIPIDDPVSASCAGLNMKTLQPSDIEPGEPLLLDPSPEEREFQNEFNLLLTEHAECLGYGEDYAELTERMKQLMTRMGDFHENDQLVFAIAYACWDEDWEEALPKEYGHKILARNFNHGGRALNAHLLAIYYNWRDYSFYTTSKGLFDEMESERIAVLEWTEAMLHE